MSHLNKANLFVNLTRPVRDFSLLLFCLSNSLKIDGSDDITEIGQTFSFFFFFLPRANNSKF